MKKVYLLLLLLPAALFSRDIELDLELFSIGYQGHFYSRSRSNHFNYIEMDLPTLFINDIESNLSLFITPGQVYYDLDHEGYTYNPLLMGLKWTPFEFDEIFLGPFTKVIVNSDGELDLWAGLNFNAGLALLEDFHIFNRVLVKGVDIKLGYDFRHESIFASISMDPVVAAVLFAYFWAEDLYLETQI